MLGRKCWLPAESSGQTAGSPAITASWQGFLMAVQLTWGGPWAHAVCHPLGDAVPAADWHSGTCPAPLSVRRCVEEMLRCVQSEGAEVMVAR